MSIHPTAIVDPGARIAESAEIGPYCIVGAEVEIGARTRLMANLYLEGPTWIGEDNLFYPFSTVGVASQDLQRQPADDLHSRGSRRPHWRPCDSRQQRGAGRARRDRRLGRCQSLQRS